MDIQTLPFPGFPTDMQAQVMVLSALADGSSVITENIFENRFMFASELVRLGANIRIESHTAMIHGVQGLLGRSGHLSRFAAAAARLPSLALLPTARLRFLLSIILTVDTSTS